MIKIQKTVWEGANLRTRGSKQPIENQDSQKLKEEHSFSNLQGETMY